MKTFEKNDFVWHVFEFSKPFLKDLDGEDGKIFDAFVKELNMWTYTIGDDIRYFISTKPLGNALVYQIEKNLTEQNRCFLDVVCENDEIVGVVLLSERTDELFNFEKDKPMKKIFVDDIVVNPYLFDKGIGSRILSDVLGNMNTLAGAEDVCGVYCNIKQDNKRSFGLFKKYGFAGTGIKKYGSEIFFKPIDKTIERSTQ